MAATSTKEANSDQAIYDEINRKNFAAKLGGIKALEYGVNYLLSTEAGLAHIKAMYKENAGDQADTSAAYTTGFMPTTLSHFKGDSYSEDRIEKGEETAFASKGFKTKYSAKAEVLNFVTVIALTLYMKTAERRKNGKTDPIYRNLHYTIKEAAEGVLFELVLAFTIHSVKD